MRILSNFEAKRYKRILHHGKGKLSRLVGKASTGIEKVNAAQRKYGPRAKQISENLEKGFKF